MFSISHDEQQMLHCQSKPLSFENLWKPHVETAPNCPRCASSNTKFCYYNNYSFSQPRYFCKDCRRYWTKGGTLRNVPVGGGCRKSRRTKLTRSSPISTSSTSRNFSNDSSNMDADSITRPSITTSGSSIDLAAVFAKFMNQDVVIEQHELSDLAMDDHLVQHVSVGAYVDDQKVLQQEQEEERIIGEYTRPEDPNGFGIQDLLLNDPVVEDALWSDTTLTWQPMVQLQEFDQTLSCDNWSSSFDLPNYEVFPML